MYFHSTYVPLPHFCILFLCAIPHVTDGESAWNSSGWGNFVMLWRNPSFIKLWLSQSLSQFGSQIVLLGIPLIAAYMIKASPEQMGMLRAAEYLPFILFGLLAGVYSDRFARKPVLVLSNLLRFLLLLTIPAVSMLDTLNIAYLLVIAFFLGICTVLYDVFSIPYLPELIEREQLADGNSKLQISASIAVIVGPGITGLLTELFSGATSILLSAFMFIGSAVSLIGIKRRDEVRINRHNFPKNLFSEIKDGFSYLRQQPLIFAFTRCAVLWNLAWYSYSTIYILYLANSLKDKAAATGFIFAFLGIGSLLGALLIKHLSKYLGLGKSTLITAILGASGSVFVLLARGNGPFDIILLCLGQFLFGLGTTCYNINATALRQYVTPNALQGKVNATVRFITWGINPVGSFLGGFLGSSIGLPDSLAVSCIIFFLAVGSLFFSELPHVESLAAIPTTGQQEAM